MSNDVEQVIGFYYPDYILPLALNETARVLSQFTDQDELKRQAVLDGQECLLLKALLEKKFRTYDEMEETIGQDLRVVRYVLSHLNDKLAPFHIQIMAVLDAGFLLMPKD